ncbi:MAG: rhodanese-like domain-containing protein [Cetobacterium sp.]
MKNYKTLTQNEVKELIKEKDVILLDVRTEDEYSEKHVEGALNIPLSELEERVLELEKDKTYITFCRSGVRSKAAILILLDKEFQKVYNSEEGISTWI